MMNLQQRDLQSVWHPFTQMKLNGNAIAIVKGEGVYLIDDAGKKYIDAISSWWVNIHGHAHPYIAEKVYEQLKTLEHVIFAGFTHQPAIELAERLLKLLPEEHTKIFYSDNGSTAVEAEQYWHNQNIKRTEIIALRNAYHGDTFGAMSVSQRSAYTRPFDSKLFEVKYIDVPVIGKEAEAEKQLKELIKSKNIAAFIFEPLIQGAGGMVMYEADALNKLIAICKNENILCIADEVMTGFARTGKMFASDYLQDKPDIICMSKGITGGTMALGATSCSENIYHAFYSDDRLKTFFHGHSYTANPVACAAALANLDLFEQVESHDGVFRISNTHKQFVDELKKYDNVRNPRSKGTILAFEYLTNENDSYFHSKRDTIYQFFLEKGILLRPLGNTIYIMPPYCITNDELMLVYDSIRELLNKTL
jgi:adenosylmethionine---8-amino-7-oxononanoate aminotransferase